MRPCTLKALEMSTDFSQFRLHISKRIPISDDEFSFYTSLIEVIQLKKRQFFVQAGEVFHLQAYVNQGCLSTYYTDHKAHNHVVQIGVEDWWIGDFSSFVTGKPTIYTIEALEDCELFAISAKNIELVFERIPKFERFYRLLIQNAYISFQRRVIEGMSKSAEERFLDFIQKYPALKNRVAQHHIASYLGISPEALSRIKKSMIEREKSSS